MSTTLETALEIRTFRSEKKGIRVDLFRRYSSRNPETGKKKPVRKQIGSFLLSAGCPSDLLTLLKPDEVIILANWLAEVDFSKQFNTEADAMAKYSIHLPKQVYDALTQLYFESKRLNIDFIPSKVMLECLIQKAKLVQHKIDKENKIHSGILESIGLDTQVVKSKEVDTESRILFKTLYEMGNKIGMGKICTQLEEAAKYYGRDKRIPPPQLEDWAGIKAARKADKPIHDWCFAIAIDVLLKHGVNPITLAKPEKVAFYWARLREDRFTLEEAKREFNKIFNMPDYLKPTVYRAIESVYQRI